MIKYLYELRDIDKTPNNIFKNCVSLTEANMRRIAYGHDDSGYAIMSASRDSNRYYNDVLKGNPNELNDIRTEQIRELIHDYGYTFVPVYGGYEENGEGSKRKVLEKSFIIYPYKRNKTLVDWGTFEKDMYEIANSQDENGDYIFNQDSILFKKPDESLVYKNPRTREDEFYPGDNVTENDTDQTYFTALKKWKDLSLNKNDSDFDKGKPQRFTFTEAYFVEQPQTINGNRKRQQHDGELTLFGYNKI